MSRSKPAKVETVEKQKKAIDYLKKKKEELEAKLAQGGVIDATAPNGAASSGPRAEELAELQRANEELVAQLKAAKAQEEELVRKLKQLASAYRQLKEQGSSNTAELEARAARLDAREAELKRAGVSKKAAKQLHAHVNSLRQELTALKRSAASQDPGYFRIFQDSIRIPESGVKKEKGGKQKKIKRKMEDSRIWCEETASA